MKTFKQFLYEGAGNLTGLPPAFVKRITKYKQAGENSNIILYKAKAKQADLVKATKQVEETKDYSAVLVKVNGEWSFLADADGIGSGNKKFRLITADDTYVTQTYWRSKIGAYGIRSGLTPTELGDVVDFDKNTVDIYIVSVDEERLSKQANRRQTKAVEPVSPAKKEAIKKFLDKKSGGLLTSIKDELNSSVEKLMSILDSESASKDEEFNKILDNMKETYANYNSLLYYVNSISNEGVIKDDFIHWHGSKNTTMYKLFLELIDKLKKTD
jgi:hypothetical protein